MGCPGISHDSRASEALPRLFSARVVRVGGWHCLLYSPPVLHATSGVPCERRLYIEQRFQD